MDGGLKYEAQQHTGVAYLGSKPASLPIHQTFVHNTVFVRTILM